MPTQTDHFSAQAAAYAAFRPHYPDAVFDYLTQVCDPTLPVWDCATGSGQAAGALASRFPLVYATDRSAAQLRKAEPDPKVVYRVGTAEASGLAAQSVGLVTVAQALHWFDLDRFYAEVRRVVRPDGVIAVWSYALLRVAPEIDRLLDQLHDDRLRPFWADERWHVIDGYRNLAFPFRRLDCPTVAMTAEWTADDCLGYLHSWSGVQACKDQTGEDAVSEISAALRDSWGAGTRPVHWPLNLRAGVVA